MTQADRRRRAARIAALASAAGLADTRFAPPALADALEEYPLVPDAAVAPGGVVMADRFLAAGTAGSGSGGRQQRLLAAAAAMAVVVVAIAGVSFVSNRTPAAHAAAAVAPLELLALAHQRVDGSLTVSGLVRNPAGGARVDQLEAEVRVFDPAGILVATRSALDRRPGTDPRPGIAVLRSRWANRPPPRATA